MCAPVGQRGASSAVLLAVGVNLSRVSDGVRLLAGCALCPDARRVSTHLQIAALLAVPRVGRLPIPHRLQRCSGGLQQGPLGWERAGWDVGGGALQGWREAGCRLPRVPLCRRSSAADASTSLASLLLLTARSTRSSAREPPSCWGGACCGGASLPRCRGENRERRQGLGGGGSSDPAQKQARFGVPTNSHPPPRTAGSRQKGGRRPGEPAVTAPAACTSRPVLLARWAALGRRRDQAGAGSCPGATS